MAVTQLVICPAHDGSRLAVVRAPVQSDTSWLCVVCGYPAYDSYVESGAFDREKSQGAIGIRLCVEPEIAAAWRLGGILAVRELVDDQWPRRKDDRELWRRLRLTISNFRLDE